MPKKWGFTLHCFRQPESKVSFSNSFSPAPATIFHLPFKLCPHRSSLSGKHLHTAACGGDQPSSSPDPAVLVGAAGATCHPQAAPGLGKMTSASTKATQLLFEVPMPSSPSPHLHFIMWSFLGCGIVIPAFLISHVFCFTSPTHCLLWVFLTLL